MLNLNIILQMVSSYMRNNQLTYDDFEKIFDFLSQKEKYKVADALEKNKVELIDDYPDIDTLDEREININDEDLAFLNDDAPFQIEKKEKTNFQEKTIVRKDVTQSNLLLLHEIQEGNKQALQDFCVKNKRLVDKYAVMYQSMLGNKLEFDDLEQAGMIGMLKAVYRFDFRGEFSTYAVYWIRQSIYREIMDHGFTIRIPVHMMEAILKVARADSKHADITEYNKRIQVIAKDIEIPVERVDYLLCLRKLYLSTTSLDVPVGEDQDSSLEEVIPIENETSIEDKVSLIMLRATLDEILSTLTDREQSVLRLRFGLDDGRSRTLEEIGQEYGVTRERIRQIEDKALKKLRHPSRSRKLKDYLN